MSEAELTKILVQLDHPSFTAIPEHKSDQSYWDPALLIRTIEKSLPGTVARFDHPGTDDSFYFGNILIKSKFKDITVVLSNYGNLACILHDGFWPLEALETLEKTLQGVGAIVIPQELANQIIPGCTTGFTWMDRFFSYR